MAETFTLYTNRLCPYAQRVEIALQEVGLNFNRFEIDLQNKPEWYASKVNPASKVPAIAYGGPAVPADQPSPEFAKIAESLILLEFINDIDPSHRLLPADPIQKAKARFFIEVSGKFITTFFAVLLGKGEPVENLLKAVEEVQELLPKKGKGKYAVGDEFTIADVAIAPFVARMDVTLKNEIGLFPVGLGKKTYETLQSDAKFEGYREYYNALKERESFKKTFDEDAVAKTFKARLAGAQRQTACCSEGTAISL